MIDTDNDGDTEAPITKRLTAVVAAVVVVVLIVVAVVGVAMVVGIKRLALFFR